MNDYEKINVVGLQAIRALRALEAAGAWRYHWNDDVDECPICLRRARAGEPLVHIGGKPCALAEEALVAANIVVVREDFQKAVYGG